MYTDPSGYQSIDYFAHLSSNEYGNGGGGMDHGWGYSPMQTGGSSFGRNVTFRGFGGASPALGSPGVGINGTGWHGVYYDWHSGQYRSTATLDPIPFSAIIGKMNASPTEWVNVGQVSIKVRKGVIDVVLDPNGKYYWWELMIMEPSIIFNLQGGLVSRSPEAHIFVGVSTLVSACDLAASIETSKSNITLLRRGVNHVRANRSAASAVAGVTIALNVSATMADYYDYKRADQVTTGDDIKMGVNFGLTTIAVTATFIPGVNIVFWLGLGAFSAMHNYGAFDPYYKSFNK